MSKEQIEEMGFIIQENSPLSKISSEDVAEILYNAGYRKQSEPFSCGHEKGCEWISVDERLPNESGYFLVYIPRESEGFRVNAYYYCENETWEDGNGMASSEYYGITHWMPLPEAPKMKGGAE